MDYHSFDSLIANADIISIHTPLNKDTKYIISRKEFSKMKTNVLIINTARGGVINEEDLIEAINTKTISGAALDVFENEPNINPTLKTIDNVIIVPHIGTASIDCRIEMGKEAGANIINFFNATPTNIVN